MRPWTETKAKTISRQLPCPNLRKVGISMISRAKPSFHSVNSRCMPAVVFGSRESMVNFVFYMRITVQYHAVLFPLLASRAADRYLVASPQRKTPMESSPNSFKLEVVSATPCRPRGPSLRSYEHHACPETSNPEKPHPGTMRKLVAGLQGDQ